MKKLGLSFVVLALVQFIVLFGMQWLVISARNDCSFVTGSFMEWQCSSDADPTLIPLISFAILPPVIAKIAFDKFKFKFSWRRIILTHIFAGLVLLGLLVYLDANSCNCGGA